MHILAYDKYPAPDSGLTYAELPELLRQADVISLHCPLTDETRHMIDAAAIASMKPGAVLINTSRGALVDTEALIEGLRSRKVGAACLDVYEEEADVFYDCLLYTSGFRFSAYCGMMIRKKLLCDQRSGGRSIKMADIREITDLSAPELDVFARLTEAQLRNRLERCV